MLSRRALARALLVLPAGVGLARAAEVSDQRPIGQGMFRWFGLDIYRATLSAAPGFDPVRFEEHPFSLELEYRRRFEGADIAQRSVEEMAGIAPLPEASARDWLAAMRRVFPDVQPGDRLLGVHEPGVGARFFHNARPIGRVDDPRFSARFFGIWLSPRTSEPRLRAALIAGAAR